MPEPVRRRGEADDAERGIDCGELAQQVAIPALVLVRDEVRLVDDDEVDVPELDALRAAELESQNADLRAEVERWGRRVKMLEERIAIMVAVGQGNPPPIAKKLQDPLAPVPRDEAVELEAVGHFADAMLAKLARNRHKAHWAGLTKAFLTDRLHEEFGELQVALESGFKDDPPDHYHRPEDIMDEAVDVAAMAMMLFDNARRRSSV